MEKKTNDFEEEMRDFGFFYRKLYIIPNIDNTDNFPDDNLKFRLSFIENNKENNNMEIILERVTGIYDREPESKVDYFPINFPDKNIKYSKASPEEIDFFCKALLKKRVMSRIELGGYTYINEWTELPFLAAQEIRVLNNVTKDFFKPIQINLCVSENLRQKLILKEDYKIKYSSYGIIYPFDKLKDELSRNKNKSLIPLLICEDYKKPAFESTDNMINVHSVSIFFNQACANNQNEKEFIIVDSLLDYVEKDEQLFRGIESIFKDELNGKDEEQKKQFIRNKLKKSSLYQYPFQSENNCGRFAVKFYARFANCNNLNEIRNKSRETLLEVSSEISDEVTQVTKKQEKRSVRQWDDNLVEKGYAKVNLLNKVFAVRIPKSDKIDFDNNYIGFKLYSNPDNKYENFYEKACHGQGILTGGLLLNLGVSRKQLKEIVRNRGKQIEINIIEPVQSNNISINTKINIDGKELYIHKYLTNFGFIPKSPSLNYLNFEKIERQIKVNNNDNQVKNIKKHRRLSR